jgi:hypothetical protein
MLAGDCVIALTKFQLTQRCGIKEIGGEPLLVLNCSYFFESALWPLELGDGDGAIKGNYRRWSYRNYTS